MWTKSSSCLQGILKKMASFPRNNMEIGTLLIPHQIACQAFAFCCRVQSVQRWLECLALFSIRCCIGRFRLYSVHTMIYYTSGCCLLALEFRKCRIMIIRIVSTAVASSHNPFNPPVYPPSPPPRPPFWNGFPPRYPGSVLPV